MLNGIRREGVLGMNHAWLLTQRDQQCQKKDTVSDMHVWTPYRMNRRVCIIETDRARRT